MLACLLVLPKRCGWNSKNFGLLILAFILFMIVVLHQIVQDLQSLPVWIFVHLEEAGFARLSGLAHLSFLSSQPSPTRLAGLAHFSISSSPSSLPQLALLLRLQQPQVSVVSGLLRHLTCCCGFIGLFSFLFHWQAFSYVFHTQVLTLSLALLGTGGFGWGE